MRETRLQFLAFGVLPALNGLLLFIHSIFIVTGTTGGAGAALVVTLLAVLVMVIAVVGYFVLVVRLSDREYREVIEERFGNGRKG